MRYGIFSDVHSNLEALDAVIEAYKKEKIDKYLCVGDIVGYAANPAECIKKIEMLAKVTVAGNHDWASVNLFSSDYFNPLAKKAISWTKRNLSQEDIHFLEGLPLIYKNEDLAMVHGTLDAPGDFNYMTDSYIASGTFELLEAGICFVGHTHVPEVFIKYKDGGISCGRAGEINIEENNKYIINVGSVGQPRDGNPEAAYCVYDTKEKSVQIKRINYDIESARKKIMDSGLPGFEGERLLEGR
ncbi:MAG: metallophosphoesterase family protein [Candidatus Omnitrophica bacterium]|jgi:predicted phosphodiesterase|nr:metallophosphoesterase family protein [Candidatus Omnitrophota bacterium]